MSNRKIKWIDVSKWDRKWQRIEDVKGMWYTEWMRDIKPGECCKVCREIEDCGKCKELSMCRSNCTNGDKRAEAWGRRSAEGRKVNVLEMKCLKGLVGVSRVDRVRNVEVRRRALIERELARTWIREY